MKSAIFIIVLILSYFTSISQCECTDCPIHISDWSTEVSTLNITGSNNPDLGVNGQELCRVCLNFHTETLLELNFTLIAPNGTEIQLIQDAGWNVSGDMDFEICFVPCSKSPEPDPGHNPVFTSNDAWSYGDYFNGTYHPNNGCLEDLTGNINGDWKLKIEDVFSFGDTDLNDWYLVFQDDDGLNCTHAEECFVCKANAGIISIDNTPVCPTEIITFNINNYNSTDQYNEFILIVNDNNEIVQIFEGDSYSFSSDHCGNFSIYSYNILIGGTSTIPNIGDLITDYDCINNCCDLIGEPFSIEDDSPPIFTFIPENPNYPIGYDYNEIFCMDEINLEEQAEYSDNCLGIGSVDPMITNYVYPCDGGIIIRKWEVIDSCALEPTVVEQTITIEPTPPAKYINLPADTTLDCDKIPQYAEDLFYTNNINGDCEISGMVSPIRTENYSVCGGKIIFTWKTTDDCDREIKYIQTITVNPAPLPKFIDLPLDTLILDCGVTNYIPSKLKYSNNSNGNCLYEGFVDGVTTQDSNILNVIWKLDLPCADKPLIYNQTILFRKKPVILIYPKDTTICLDDSFNLLDIIVIDTNNTNANISFHYFYPPDSSNIITDSIVYPNDTSIYYIKLSTVDSCTSFVPFKLNIEIPEKIADNGKGIVCNGDSKYSLFDFLSNIVSTNGIWEKDANLNMDISNPFAVSFKNVTAGNYQLIYYKNSSDQCNSDTAYSIITVQDAFNIYIDSVFCSSDTLYYSVNFHVQENISIITNYGDITYLGFGNYSISQISLKDTLTILGSDNSFLCENSIQILPPDCSCPFISPPSNDGDIDVCLHELPVTLSVNVKSDNTASWYLSPTDGTPLAIETLLFTPKDTLPGVYSFFVETIDLENNCVSKSRTLVKLNILESPFAIETTINNCQNYTAGKIEFFLSQLNDSITNNSNDVSYYKTFNDALSGINKLDDKIVKPDAIDLELFAKVKNDNGCFTIVPVYISINAFPNASIFVNPSNILDCSVQKVELSSSDEKNTFYQWTFENSPISSSELILDQEGQVVLVAIDTTTGCQSIDTLNILDLEAYPSVNITNTDTLTCLKTSVLLDGTKSQSGDNFRYYWYEKNSSQPIFKDINKIKVEKSGWYYLEIIDTALGCANIDSVFVEEVMDWNISLQPELNYSQSNKNIINTITNIEPNNVAKIEWFPNENLSCFDCLNPEITTPGISKYTVKITDIYGCSSSADINIIYNKIEVYIPNIFSPNNDGINDYFIISTIKNNLISNMQITIYNRWGEKIYFNKNLQLGNDNDFWDGKFKGKSLNPGVFIYTYKINLKNGKEIKGIGDITIIK